jgi:hypothetical protein
MKTELSTLFVPLWLLFGIYILVLLMIFADLWAGIRKAKQRGEVRTSYGFKRTVDKLAKYYNALIALTLVDAMQVALIWYLDSFYGYHIPIFPIVTLIGAVGICLIEIKSIYEKAEDKVQLDQIGNLAGKLIANKDDLKEIGKALAEYMKTPDPETQSNEQTNN